MKLISIFLYISLIACLAVHAQKTKTVSASYTFYAPESMSIEEAKREALQRTQIEAIANAFGTIIGQNNTTQIRNENGDTKMDYSSLRWSDVKGEWIETIGQPKFDIRYDNHFLIIECDIKGKAREISPIVIEIIAKPLKNGTDLRYEANNFKDGDELYLYFLSPIDGYISIYLLEESSQTVYNILPYKAENLACTKIVGNKEYIFFSKNHVEKNEKNYVDEYILTSDLDKEFHILYILFSPIELGKQRGFESDEMSLPKNIPYIDFQSWLSKSLSRNKDLQLIQYSLLIQK